MTAKELKKLRRSDLLEMLLALRRENDELRQQLEQAQTRLSDRAITLEDSESLAEAALRLNGLFTAAQAACDQYTQNVQQRMDQLEQQTAQKCQQLLDEAKEQAGSYSWVTEIMNTGEAP